MVEIKGISAIVAMVILIIITITVAGAMALWAKKYINEKTENATSQDTKMSKCLRTSMNIIGSKVDSSNSRIILTIENNGFEDISSISLKMLSDNGDVCKPTSTPPLNTGIPVGDIEIYKLDYSSCSSGNYTMFLTPSSCPEARKTVKIEI